MIENIIIEDEQVTFNIVENIFVEDEPLTFSSERTHEVETPVVEIGYLGNSIVRHAPPLKIKTLEFYGRKC